MSKYASFLAAAIASTLVSVASAFAGGPYGTIHVGNWQGGAFTDEQTGQFSHCVASASYVSGVFLSLGENSQRVWLIGFSNPAWNLSRGTTFPIDLTLDGQTQFHIFGTAVAEKLISATLPVPAVNAFRKARFMVATGSQQTVQFNLNFTDKLADAIVNCVERMKANGVAGAGDFSITSPRPPISTAAVTSPEKSPPSSPERLIDVSGTGFVVSDSGYVVTNNHVISECASDVHGNRVGESPAALRVVSTDETNDLALLQATGSFKDTVSIRGTAIHSGDAVIVIGFPFHGLLTSDFTVTTGIVSSLAGLLNDTRFLQISAPVQPGNSGGPLLDTSGALVGVVSEKLNAIKVAKATGSFPENINFAIKTGALRDFLDNSVVNYRTLSAASDLKTADIASAARSYTMLITCQAHDTSNGKK
jgi:S1-C subfamily serine protease